MVNVVFLACRLVLDKLRGIWYIHVCVEGVSVATRLDKSRISLEDDPVHRAKK